MWRLNVLMALLPFFPFFLFFLYVCDCVFVCMRAVSSDTIFRLLFIYLLHLLTKYKTLLRLANSNFYSIVYGLDVCAMRGGERKKNAHSLSHTTNIKNLKIASYFGYFLNNCGRTFYAKQNGQKWHINIACLLSGHNIRILKRFDKVDSSIFDSLGIFNWHFLECVATDGQRKKKQQHVLSIGHAIWNR